MNRDQILQFLRVLGAEEIREGDPWISCQCPLAPWAHSNGRDSRPSFGIPIDAEKEGGTYLCFSCTPEARSLAWLLHRLWCLTGEYPEEAWEILYGSAPYTEPSPPGPRLARDRWVEFNSRPRPRPLPIKVLRQYPLLQNGRDQEARKIRRWLEEERLVPEWVQNEYRLRYDYNSQAVVFPFTDSKGSPYLLRARRRNSKQIWTITPQAAGVPGYSFPKPKDFGAWFGLSQIDSKKTVVLCESEIDVMRLASLGLFNALASGGTSVTRAQIDAIHAGSLILAYDADLSGQAAHHKIKKWLSGRIPQLREADWSLARKANGESCKDAGDLPSLSALKKVLLHLK